MGPRAVGEASEADAVLGWSEAHGVHPVFGVAVGVGGHQDGFVALRGLERERLIAGRRIGAAELVLVEDRVAPGRDDPGLGNADAGRFGALAREVPATDVDGLVGDVVEFDGVFQWRVGVGEQFVDDNPAQGTDARDTRGAQVLRRRTPVRGAGEVAIGIDDLKARTQSVRSGRPVSRRTVLEADELGTVGGHQHDRFTFIRQSAAVRAGDQVGEGAVAGCELGAVPANHDTPASRDRHGSEGVGDAGRETAAREVVGLG